MLLCDMQKLLAFPFFPIKGCKWLQWLDYMKTNHFKMILNVFSINNSGYIDYSTVEKQLKGAVRPSIRKIKKKKISWLQFIRHKSLHQRYHFMKKMNRNHQILKSWWYPFFTPLKFNKSLLIYKMFDIALCDESQYITNQWNLTTFMFKK